MRQTLVIAVALAGAVAGAQTPPPAPRPPDTPFRDESLRYSVNWPSGLSLGEAQMQASGTGERWSFAFSLDAAVPGFAVSDSYQAVAAGDFCSVELLKEAAHGRRKTSERTKFEAQEGRATRESTGGGGKSELSVPACARDGLTFFYYLRRELSQGRLPGPQTVYFGAPYQVRLEYGSPQAIRVNDRPMDAERVTVSYKGPGSQGVFDLYFLRDAARTPVMVRVPLAAGAFSMELVR